VPTTRAFTLIELLVTITIIAIVAGLVLGALQSAQESARGIKTQATVTKLNNVVMERFDAYRTRRVNIDADDAWSAISPAYNPADPATHHPPSEWAARLRLLALRDTMRMEMPESWEDVENGPRALNDRLPILPATAMSATPAVAAPEPALHRSYVRRHAQALTRLQQPPFNMTLADATTLISQYGSAECLYLYIATAAPQSLEKFTDSEVGDADGDGVPEFIDAWGNPIYFLRWAPGFSESDIQPAVVSPLMLEDTAVVDWSSASPTPPGVASPPAGIWGDGTWTDVDSRTLQDRKDVAGNEQHDPFDPYKVDRRNPSDTNDYARGWRLVPLIFSAGPDGIYDIHSFPTDGSGNPATFFQTGQVYLHPVGLPYDQANTSVTSPGPEDQVLNHYDNITNHRIEARMQ
jgi:prepilin-type N-terminal cleavage/methylation domain-containing protein